jgi:hypothetical protein
MKEIDQYLGDDDEWISHQPDLRGGEKVLPLILIGPIVSAITPGLTHYSFADPLSTTKTRMPANYSI